MSRVKSKLEEAQGDRLLENGLKILRLLGFHGYRLRIGSGLAPFRHNCCIFDGITPKSSSMVLVPYPNTGLGIASTAIVYSATLRLYREVFVDGSSLNNELWFEGGGTECERRRKQLMRFLFESNIPIGILKTRSKKKLPLAMKSLDENQSLGFKSSCIEEAMIWFFGLNDVVL